MKIYLAGSLRNREYITTTAIELQKQLGCEVFADWAATSADADDNWKHYEQSRGFSYVEALKRPAAQNVYLFDKKHIDESDIMIVAMPAGKSAFLELGYHLGNGKPGYILLESNNDRWDVMFNFATGVYDKLSELVGGIKSEHMTYQHVKLRRLGYLYGKSNLLTVTGRLPTRPAMQELPGEGDRDYEI